MTRLDELDEHGRRYVLTVDLPADFALNQPLAHFALAALDVLDPESDSYTLDIVSVIESVLEAPRQILMAQQFAARGRGGRGDEGRRHRVRGADGAARPDHLAAAAGRAARRALRDLPAAAPVAARGRARPEVGRARDVGAGDGVHRLRRPLPARALRGAGAALPHRRLPHPAPDRPGRAPHPRARRPRRVAGRDDPPDRLLAARRVGGADRPRARPRPDRRARAAAPAATGQQAGAARSP